MNNPKQDLPECNDHTGFRDIIPCFCWAYWFDPGDHYSGEGKRSEKKLPGLSGCIYGKFV